MQFFYFFVIICFRTRIRYKGLVSLLNAISTSVGYLMPKPSLKKNRSDTVLPLNGGDKGVHTFHEGIISKVNLIGFVLFDGILTIVGFFNAKSS